MPTAQELSQVLPSLDATIAALLKLRVRIAGIDTMPAPTDALDLAYGQDERSRAARAAFGLALDRLDGSGLEAAFNRGVAFALDVGWQVAVCSSKTNEENL